LEEVSASIEQQLKTIFESETAFLALLKIGERISLHYQDGSRREKTNDPSNETLQS
jgi:hypothetical protein